ncbi:hypothetical protein T4B_9900 [Trichinella pseudospiralis]|uniref:Uncharacterized protein n=1 Tax=Trichinella pseudospiralis TaxID=6337 RepID=A0A0V1IG64_TRIPS|nr:hypothetical protein T4B_9900 [Trichinella pseudospiralis]
MQIIVAYIQSQLDPTPRILWNVNTTGPVDLTLIRDAWVKEKRQAEHVAIGRFKHSKCPNEELFCMLYLLLVLSTPIKSLLALNFDTVSS